MYTFVADIMLERTKVLGWTFNIRVFWEDKVC